MTNLDYIIDYKILLNESNLNRYKWDVFISCYNNSERVHYVYDRINACEKKWIIIPEYEYTIFDYPKEDYLIGNSFNEAEMVSETLGEYLVAKPNDIKICIDITGFMRPQIMFIVKYLLSKKKNNFDMIYSEPAYYAKRSDTAFTTSDILSVRQVAGYEGCHTLETQNDALILGVGYDHDPMSRVILNKDNARLILFFSLPSLSADMYQESMLRLEKVSNLTRKVITENTFYASANDPYVIATELSAAYKIFSSRQKISNLYLCPLATKAQTLGFTLFFMRELQSKPASIIFPFPKSYAKETSKGIGRIWLYPICLD